ALLQRGSGDPQKVHVQGRGWSRRLRRRSGRTPCDNAETSTSSQGFPGLSSTPPQPMNDHPTATTPAAIEVDLAGHPGLLIRPSAARALYVLAHGAGAGMRHAFLAAITGALAARDIATLRWEFP